jgi:hypothetical protein
VENQVQNTCFGDPGVEGDVMARNWWQDLAEASQAIA